MIHFFDSSLLIAAFDDQDSQHERAWPVFSRHAAGGAMATHSLAETFSILTRRRGWLANDAFEILRTNTAPIDKVTLPAAEYLHIFEQSQRLGIRGGAVYDALILACARRAKADAIWTLYARHFLLFAGDASSSVREP